MLYHNQIQTPLPILQSYVMRRFPEGKLTNGNNGPEWNIICFHCKHQAQRAYVNIINGKFHCFHCTKSARSWVELIQAIEKLPTVLQIDDFLNNINALEAFSYDSIVDFKIKKKSMKQNLPDGFEVFGSASDEKDNPYYQYLISRHLTHDQIHHFGIGYVNKKKSKYYQRIIFPIYYGEELQFFVDRLITKDKERPKTLGIGTENESWPVPKSSVIVNLKAAESAEDIFIVEGVFDFTATERWLDETANMGFNFTNSKAVALLGKACSGVQLHRLVHLPKAKRYFIMLDPDAIHQAYELADDLNEWGKDANLILLKDGDPNQNFPEYPDPTPYNGTERLKAIAKGLVKYRTLR